MKKIFLLMLPCCFALLLHACDSSCCGAGKVNATEASGTASCDACGKSSCDQNCATKPLGDGLQLPSCSLSAEAQARRGQEVISKVFGKANTIRELPDGWDLVFPHSPGLVAELQEIVAFERQCCAVFTWEITEEPAEKLVHLRVCGSPGVKEEVRVGFERLGLGPLMGK